MGLRVRERVRVRSDVQEGTLGTRKEVGCGLGLQSGSRLGFGVSVRTRIRIRFMIRYRVRVRFKLGYVGSFHDSQTIVLFNPN